MAHSNAGALVKHAASESHPRLEADGCLVQPLEMIRRWAQFLRERDLAGRDSELADIMENYLRRCDPQSPSGVRLRSRF